MATDAALGFRAHSGWAAAVATAGRHHGLPVVEIRESELMPRCTGELHLPPEGATRMLTELGRTLGPPWRQDEKLATLAAMLALAARR